MPDEPSPEQPRDAKAEAAAAKAYANAQRPWYTKKRWIFSIGAVLLIVITAAAGGCSADDSSDPATPASQQETPTSENEGLPRRSPPRRRSPR